MNRPTTKVLPRSVTEVCPGIHSVHGMIALAGRRLSWIADDSVAVAASNRCASSSSTRRAARRCASEDPPLVVRGDGHADACLFSE